MDNDNKKLTQSFRVQPSECNFTGGLAPAALCAYLQNSAGLHAYKLNVGVSRLLEQHLAWMLSRFRLEIFAPVDCWEDVVITTWPSGAEKMFTFREFEVKTAGGIPVAYASTAWLIFDTGSRRLVRPFPELESHYLEKRVFEAPPEKLPLPDTFSDTREFIVGKNRIDINRHANNLAYVDWVTESIPETVFFGHVCRSIELNYTNEALLSEHCIAMVQESDKDSGIFSHRIIKKASGQELCRARTQWGKPADTLI